MWSLDEDCLNEERSPPTSPLTLRPAVDDVEVVGRAMEGKLNKVADGDGGGGSGSETVISDVRGGVVERGLLRT